jgi:hypothetical protein
MKNRISKYFKKKKENTVEEIRTFFLACEYKPEGMFWNVLEPFTYDIKPAFIYGTLGILSYSPESYAIVETNDECQPLLGYIMTITETTTVHLLDRIKHFLGENSYNTHVRKLVHAYTDLNQVTNAWCYLISSHVLNTYQQIETVEFGLVNNDPKQIALLEKIIEQ